MKIDFPQHYKIHNVFLCHVSLIKPYKSNGTRHPPKPLAGFEDDNVFPVDALLDKRVTKSGKRTKTQYLVKWKGYGPEENTWVPVANILDPGLIRDYEKAHSGIIRMNDIFLVSEIRFLGDLET